jgi:FkbM family methyltransferase
MNRLSLKVVRKIVQLIAKTDLRLPGVLELDLKHMQGKGSGAGSVSIEAKMALGFLTKSGISKPIVLDIGANVGKYSEAILKVNPHATIFAFEPSAVSRKKLEQKFNGNNKVKVIPLALGDLVSTKTLWSDIYGSSLSSLTKRNLDHIGLSFDKKEQVEVVTLDSWTNTSRIIPDLIKIDVEGHELDVLRGGVETLSLARVVQFEFGGCNIDTRTFFQDFWYLLTGVGFIIYRISNSRTIRILNYSEEDEYFSTTNYLAVKEHFSI